MNSPTPSTVVPSTAASSSAATRALIAVCGSVLLLSMFQTLVVPALQIIAAQTGAQSTQVGWLTTATMLVAAAATPLAGRLGDVYGNRKVIIALILVSLAGSLLASFSDSIAMLIAGRALQGFSFGLFPLGISVLRRALPLEKLTSGMAITASVLGFGGGLGMVATGLLTQNDADFHRIFFLASAMSAVALLLALWGIPNAPGHGGSVDYVGALVLALGLTAFLLPLSQGNSWGWGSVKTIGFFILAALILAGWYALQARLSSPLINVALLKHPQLAVVNISAFLVGFGMFSVFLGITYFVQSHKDITGFGFDASVLRTSVVFLLPGALVGIVAGPIGGRLVGAIGARLVVTIACLFGMVGLFALAVISSSESEVVIASIVTNVAIALAYAAFPALLVTYVRPEDTGVANSINSIARSVGAAVGSAIVVTVLSSDVHEYSIGGRLIELPTESAFRITFIAGAIAFLIGALLTFFGIRGKQEQQLNDEEIEESEALGAAGSLGGSVGSINVDVNA